MKSSKIQVNMQGPDNHESGKYADFIVSKKLLKRLAFFAFGLILFIPSVSAQKTHHLQSTITYQQNDSVSQDSLSHSLGEASAMDPDQVVVEKKWFRHRMLIHPTRVGKKGFSLNTIFPFLHVEQFNSSTRCPGCILDPELL